MGLTVGIDLGTTYSVIAYIDPDTKKPSIIRNKLGNPTTPSIVGFLPNGDYRIGEDAREMAESGDEHTASFYKLHMGDPNFTVRHYGKSYTARDLSAMYLKRLVADAEQVCGSRITHAVITVPAYFEDAAKNDTLQAGERAGLTVLNIINEPTAACVAYGLNDSGGNQRILVYDLGGGTFDITVAEITRDTIRVLGTNGDHQLGGRDWDIAICDWLTERFLEETGIDISSDNELISTNMVKAENAKRALSSARSTRITVDNGDERCTFELTRQDFEEITSYQMTRTTDLIDDTFEAIQFGEDKRPLTWKDVDGAILVGGSTKMPMVGEYMREQGIRVLQGVHPDEAVAIGAAIQANISEYCAVAPADKGKSSFSLVGPKAVNYSLLPGAKRIEDVISHSLGMIMSSEDETRFVNDIMIPRNTSVEKARETRTRKLRVSRKRDRNKLDIYLLQGEDDNPLNCTIAKKYSFTGIDYEEGGEASLDITFLHTINGTIDISAQQHGRDLTVQEDPIPEDMSWLSKSPKELQQAGATEQPVLQGGLVLALDVSGSMYGNPLEQAKDAMLNFVSQFKDTEIEIAILAFSDQAAYACTPTKQQKTLGQAIHSLEITVDFDRNGKPDYSTVFDGIGRKAPLNAHTNLGIGNEANPLPEILKKLKSYANTDFAYAVILTDGEWDSDACRAALRDKERFVEAGLEIIGMGFGAADLQFLRNLSTRSELAKVEDIASLNENLSTIARIIQN